MNKITACLFSFSLLLSAGCSQAMADNTIEESTYSVAGDFDIQLKLYPNPFKNTLEIDLNNNGSVHSVEIRFVNLIGKEMDSKFNLPVNSMSEHFELDVKPLPAGVYFMEVTARSANGSIQKFTRKVTKL